MHREPIASSAIASLGYDETARVLEVEFAGGSVYRYFEVEGPLWRQLLEAESKGRFLNSKIKIQRRFAQVK